MVDEVRMTLANFDPAGSIPATLTPEALKFTLMGHRYFFVNYFASCRSFIQITLLHVEFIHSNPRQRVPDDASVGG